jgi:hypothetical protein
MHHQTNDFDALVETELRDGRGREDLLADPVQWWDALIQLNTSIECQLGARRLENADADDRAMVRFRRWRAGALRLLAAVEYRLSVIRSLG